MRLSKIIFSFVLLFMGSGPALAQGQSMELFDGRTLSGWKAYLVEHLTDLEDVWSVEGGILKCKGEPLGYLYTDQAFESFRLVVEWRWAPGTEPGNSGVLLRINEAPRAIPRTIEAQLKSGNAGDVFGFHGMRIDGPEDRRSEAKGRDLVGDFIGVSRMTTAEKDPGEWNRYEITLDGSDLEVNVNGQLVNQVTDCEVLSGPIGLQSEGGEIHFRKVTLTPLD